MTTYTPTSTASNRSIVSNAIGQSVVVNGMTGTSGRYGSSTGTLTRVSSVTNGNGMIPVVRNAAKGIKVGAQTSIVGLIKISDAYADTAKYTIINSNVSVRYQGFGSQNYSSFAVLNDPSPTAKLNSDPVSSENTISGPNPTVTPEATNNKSSKPYRLPPIVPSNPSDYMWNLPPHLWSRPLTASSDPDFTPSGSTRSGYSDDRYRRGRIWWKANAGNIEITSDQSDVLADALGIENNIAYRRYGFQFLWNPESFGTSVSVQMDATPQAEDRFIGVAGAFPATEAISFTVRLDRTNDFACFQANLAKPTWIEKSTTTPAFISASEVESFIPYYRPGWSFEGNNTELAGSGMLASTSEKIIDLMQRGTLADVEFLYRAINGPGPGAGANAAKWINGRGIATSDIGFLMPTLLNIDIGPLSYQGFVNNLSVQHTSFTPDMTPIRTDVTISLNVMATAGLTTTKGESK